MSAKFCTKCGATLLPGAKFCNGCGTPAPVIEEPVLEAAAPEPVLEAEPAAVAPQAAAPQAPPPPPQFTPPPQPQYAPPPAPMPPPPPAPKKPKKKVNVSLRFLLAIIFYGIILTAITVVVMINWFDLRNVLVGLGYGVKFLGLF